MCKQIKNHLFSIFEKYYKKNIDSILTILIDNIPENFIQTEDLNKLIDWWNYYVLWEA